MGAIQDLVILDGFPFLYKYLKDMFYNLGIWDINSGQAQYGYLGSRFTNVFGADCKIVTSPTGWLLGYGQRKIIFDLILGLGDNIEMCLGSDIRLAYGGPHANVRRGPTITKLGGNVDLAGWLDWNAPATDLNWYNRFAASHSVDRKNDVINTPQAAEDDKYGIAAGIIAQIASLTTAVIELYIRFAFGRQYLQESGHLDIQGPADKTLLDLEITHRILPRRLLAIVYYIEQCGALSAQERHLTQDATSTLKKVVKCLSYILVFPGLMVTIAESLVGRIGDTTRWVMLGIGMVILILVVLLAVLA